MPQGIDTPGVEEFPWGDKTSGVPIEGKGVLGEDGRGRIGDGNPPTTRATEASKVSGGDKGMPHGPGTAALLSPQRGTVADRYRAGPMHRHYDSANGARPENGIQLRRDYSLLTPEELVSDPAVAGTQVRGAGHEATSGTDDLGQTAMETGDETGQHALLARGMPEVNDGKKETPQMAART